MEETHQSRFEQLHFDFLHKHRNNYSFNPSQNASHDDFSSNGSSFGDSGYTSCQLTPNNTFNGSSVTRQKSLATIEEDSEVGQFFATNSATVTPTTACFQKILGLHLSTPEEPQKFGRKRSFNENLNQLTPNKKNNISFATIKTPLRTISPNQKSLGANVTPKKTKLSIKRKHSCFRDKLYSDGDIVEKKACLDFGGSIEEDCKKLSQKDISPILINKALRHKNPEIDDLIRSSTPKTAGFRSNFYIETNENIDWNAMGLNSQTPNKKKSRIIRKFQSFSPSKMCLRNVNEKASKLKRQNAIPEEKYLNDSMFNEKSGIFSDCSFDISMKSASKDHLNLTPIKSENLHKLFEAPIIPTGTIPKPLILNSKESQINIVDITSTDVGILFPKIPRTPQKDKNKKLFKRVSSRSSSIKKDKREHKFTNHQTLKSYVGIDRLNILERLKDRNIPAFEIILNYLTETDLVTVVLVSKNWRNIIETHKKSNKRLRDFIRKTRPIKENLKKDKNSSWLQDTCDKNRAARHPFAACNSILCSSTERRRRSLQKAKSPPISPSKRKFRENQKIASHLKKSDKLTTCPRCVKPSRIIFSKTDKTAVKKSFTLPESHPNFYSLEHASTDSDDSLTSAPSTKIRRNLFATNIARAISVDSYHHNNIPRMSEQMNTRLDNTFKQISDYAICSGQNCGFKFCIKCLCEYHPNTICKDLDPHSPSKEEERKNRRNIMGTKQSKKSLFRLCK